MARSNIDRLIINSPYFVPQKYWSYDPGTRLFDMKEGRRPAGYIVASERSKTFDDPGIFVEIPLVNQIRPRIKQWREAGYPGVTGITRRLLAHWQDEEERDYRRFFYCQLEAIETIIWLAEGPAAGKVGIEIPSDGGAFPRRCSKMATGTGKTIVMALLIAWQVLNKVSYPQDPRYSKNVFIAAPGLTVRNRLQVLIPSSPGNYYEEFNIIPPALLDKLRQGKVMIRNWQALSWETEEKLAKKKSVDKRGVKSDEAYVREVLEEMASTRNIIVINDEAHHAWRVPAESKVKGKKKDEIEEATKWVGGLDRIHNARTILCCYDFSATPFAPSGKKSSEEALFGWIISDFGLNDAIESGLVKTPRVVIRDDGVPDAKTYRSQLYHIYEWVKDDLNRPAQEHEPLPDLVTNGYYLLGKDWLETYRLWKESKKHTPPVMISVANRTETAARIKYAFDHERILIPELCNAERILHIDSRVLDEAEAQDEVLFINPDVDDEEGENTAPGRSKKEKAELLRQMVDTVGQVGKTGQHIQNVISVGMLSEGWDAKTVTHIMGLRAFSSQLLCEQVVGRGLRRTAYEVNPEGMFEPEYVNIFGIPFTFIPHEGADGTPPPPPRPKTRIEPDEDKAEFQITWPNIIRIDTVYQPRLVLEVEQVESLALDTMYVKEIVDLAPIVEGHPDISRISQISLEGLAREYRMQRIVFKTAGEIFDQMQTTWKGNREYLLAQIVYLVEQFIKSNKVSILPPFFAADEFRKRLVLTLNMSKVVQHIWNAIRYQNTEKRVLVFDHERPIRSTGDMPVWYTGKPCAYTVRSHVNFCVLDSAWEASESYVLDNHDSVAAWVKNDHLGFDIPYIYQGAVRKYRPDFIIKLVSGEYLVLEVKGRDTHQDKTKRQYLKEWVEAVNQDGRFGKWQCTVSYHPKDVGGILETCGEKIRKGLMDCHDIKTKY
jgi:type III restriction enzyme